MSSMSFSLFFAVLMAAAIVAMLGILVGLVKDTATGSVHNSRGRLAKLRSLCPVAVDRSTQLSAVWKLKSQARKAERGLN